MKRISILALLFSFALSGCQSLPAPADGGTEPRYSRHLNDLPPAATPRGDAMFHVLVAEIAARRGQLSIAAANYLQAAQILRDPQLVEQAVQYALVARDEERALSAVRLWVELAPDRIEARRVLVMLLVRAGEREAAHQQLHALIELGDDDDHLQTFSEITGIVASDGDLELALELFAVLAEHYAELPEAHHAHAHAALRARQPEVAAAAIERALALRPAWPEALLLRAQLLQQAGDGEAAIALLRDALTDSPDGLTLRLGLARMLVDGGQYPQALAEYLRVLEQDDGNADARMAAALVSLQLGETGAAEKHLLTLLDSGQRVPEASYFLGQVAEEAGQPERALEWYRTVHQGPYYLDAQVRIAVLLSVDGDLDEARGHLRSVEPASGEEEVRLYIVEAELLRRNGHHRDAFNILSEALQSHPDNYELLYARALVAERVGHTDVTESDLRRMLELEPDSALALNALGYTLADRNQRLDEAYAMIQRAYEQEPQSAAVLDSMGWVYYRMGNLQQALHYLQRAIEIDFEAEIAAHLGEVLWMLDRRDEAREMWQRAVETDPDHPVLNETIQRLDR